MIRVKRTDDGIFSKEGTLQEDHIWNLAKSITSRQQLRDMALNVLKIPGYTLDSALYNEIELQDAPQEVLQTSLLWTEQ